jgi:hypothetical protein
MTALHSKISWTIGTLNLTVGCDSLSAACDNCHARRHVGRGLHGSRDFETLQLFPERLRDLRKFRPARGEDGLLYPKMVFVNSLSDFWHADIPEQLIHDALDGFEQYPNPILQILTKRPSPHAAHHHQPLRPHWCARAFLARRHMRGQPGQARPRYPPRHEGSGRRFYRLFLGRAGRGRHGRNAPPPQEGPRVRILLPPAASRVRTVFQHPISRAMAIAKTASLPTI